MSNRWLIGLLFTLGSAASLAQTYSPAPADGLWWNPAESGRGWTFETQNNITVVTHYTYSPTGSSTFFTTAGVWDGVNKVLNAGLFGSSNGQCIGCPYTRPVSTDLGVMRFLFTSKIKGTAIYPNGTTIPIEKYNFVYSDPRAYLKGDWATSWVSSTSGVDFTHFLRLATDCTACSTANTVEGQLIINYNAGRVALGAPVPNSPGVYLVLIDSSTSFYDYYFILAEANAWTGLACVKRKTDPAPTVSQCTGLLFGSRIKTRAAVQGTASAPIVAKQLIEHDAANQRIAYLDSNEIADIPPALKQLSDTSWNSLLNDMRRKKSASQ